MENFMEQYGEAGREFSDILDKNNDGSYIPPSQDMVPYGDSSSKFYDVANQYPFSPYQNFSTASQYPSTTTQWNSTSISDVSTTAQWDSTSNQYPFASNGHASATSIQPTISDRAPNLP